MPVVHPIQTNFGAGVFSPRLEGRTDIARYASAVRTLENMIVLPQGAAMRRPGTRFVNEVKVSGSQVRLIPFRFSDEQEYILEVGAGAGAGQYIRFYKDGGRIEPVPGTPYEITHPWNAIEIENLRWAQSADVMYLASGQRLPHKLSRFGHANWTLFPVDAVGPALEENTNTGWIITPSATGPVGTVITLTANTDTWLTGHLGALWGIAELDGSLTPPADQIGYGVITQVIDPRTVKLLVKGVFKSTAPSSRWREGAWSGVRGFPRVATFFENRLYFAASTYRPQTLWGSKTGDYENFAPGVKADDSVAFTIASDQVNVIRWMVASRFLLIGTIGETFRLTGTDAGNAVTPTSVSVRPEPAYGSGTAYPVKVGNVVLFPQKSGRKLRELAFSIDDDGYKAPDLSILAEHVLSSPIRGMAFQPEPEPILWVYLTDGKLVAVTYERSNDVVGWHTHTLGGNGQVISAAVIQSVSRDRDELWLIARRLIGGTMRNYIERMESTGGHYGALGDGGYMVDSCLPGVAGGGTTVGGLSHLEGETVTILADGAVHPPKVVSGGQITLDYAPTFTVEVGLPFTPSLETLRPEVQIAGSSQTLMKRWVNVWARVHRTGNFILNGDIVEFRLGEDYMDTAVPLFTGDVRVLNPGWDRDARITLSQPNPLPLTVIAITGNLDVSGQ